LQHSFGASFDDGVSGRVRNRDGASTGEREQGPHEAGQGATVLGLAANPADSGGVSMVQITEKQLKYYKFYEYKTLQHIKHCPQISPSRGAAARISGNDSPDKAAPPPLCRFGPGGEYDSNYDPPRRLSLRKKLNVLIARKLRRMKA